MPFKNYKQTNNARGLLNAGILANTTTVILQSSQGGLFPTSFPFLAKIEQFDGSGNVIKREIVEVTNRVGDTLTVTRSAGYCPSSYTATTQTNTAFAFNYGDALSLVPTAEQENDQNVEIARLETDKLNKSGGALTGRIDQAKGANIASATTTDLATATGNLVHITGNATITAFGTVQAGTEITLVFDGALTLTHNATSLILPSGANITTAIGDTAIMRSEGSGNWKCISYNKANGQAVSGGVDINGLSEITTPGKNDPFIHYNNAAGANRKILFYKLKAAISKFGGDGSDGSVTGSADITLSGSNNSLLVKQYSVFSSQTQTQAYTNDPASGSNIVLNMTSTTLFASGDFVRVSSSAGSEIAKVTAVSAGVSITVDVLSLNHTTSSPLVTRLRKFTVSPTNCITYLKINGDFDCTNWVFDFSGKGAAGGAQAGGTGTSGNPGSRLITDCLFAGQAGNAGAYQGAGGATAVQSLTIPTLLPPTFSGYIVGTGSGGGSGGASQTASGSGIGGSGGGCLIIEVSGNVTLGTAPTAGTTYHHFMAQGQNGANSGSNNGPGGGGGGGVIQISYIGTLSGTTTSNVAGGTGGTPGSTGGFCGGAGGGGASMINIGAGATGFVSGSSGNPGVGGVGGAGAYNIYNVATIM